MAEQPDKAFWWAILWRYTYCFVRYIAWRLGSAEADTITLNSHSLRSFCLIVIGVFRGKAPNNPKHNGPWGPLAEAGLGPVGPRP